MICRLLVPSQERRTSELQTSQDTRTVPCIHIVTPDIDQAFSKLDAATKVEENDSALVAMAGWKSATKQALLVKSTAETRGEVRPRQVVLSSCRARSPLPRDRNMVLSRRFFPPRNMPQVCLDTLIMDQCDLA